MVQRFTHFFSMSMLFAFCFLANTAAIAQEKIINGKVTDISGLGLPSVSIAVKGTSKNTITDFNGDYSINISTDKDVLVFSFIGFFSQEIQTNGKTSINVSLKENETELKEVVVTALGIKKDSRKISYSIQEVKGKELIKAREPNAINSLVGKVAGLTIGSSSEILGRPNVILRGSSEILYVVNGVPINSDTWNISADDIETYTILKGPNAAALYGSRGKNGAIMITTKRATKKELSVQYNSSTMMESGFNTLPRVQDLYGPGDHGQYSFVDGRGGGINDGDYDIWGPKFDPSGNTKIAQYDSPIDPITGNRIPTPWIARGKNNLQRFLNDGLLVNNNIAISSSNDNSDIRFSISNNYQKGIVPNTQLNSNNFSVTAGVNLTKKLRFETNLNYNHQSTPNIPDVSYGPNSLIYDIVIWGGADWNVDDLKNYWQAGKEGSQQIYAEYQRYNNPYFVANEWLRSHNKNDVYGYASVDYKLNDDLSIMGRTSITTYDIFRSEKVPYSATTYGREEARGDYREDKRNLFENNTDLLIKYNKNFGNNIGLKLVGGANIRTFKYNSSFVTTDYLNTPGVYNFSNSLNPVKAFNYDSKMEVQSAYYSADVNLKKYATLSATGRVDHLSTLPKGNNTYFYPSVGLSTIVSDYIKVPEVVSMFKLRASYANVKDALTSSTIGTNPGGAFPLGYGGDYRSSYDGPSYANSIGYSVSPSYNNLTGATYSDKLNNPNIKPSTNEQLETGVEFGLFKNRFSGDVTYFVSNLGPGIFNRDLSSTSGYSSAIVNGIKTQRAGWEVSLKGTPIKSENFKWDLLMNWSTYKETLKGIYDENGISINRVASNYFVDGNSSAQFINVGDRVDKVYVNTFQRTPTGEIINDAGGRPLVNSKSTNVGYANADYVWSIINKASYKNWTIGVQFDGRVGGITEDYIRRQTFRGGRNIETVQGALGIARDFDIQGIKSYIGEGVKIISGTPTIDPATGAITNYSALTFGPNDIKTFAQDYISRYNGTPEGNLMKKTFTKLREITVTYAFPKGLLDKSFIKEATVSLVGRNLFYFIDPKHDGVDLDQFTSGARTGLQTPTLKRFGFNVNLTF